MVFFPHCHSVGTGGSVCCGGAGSNGIGIIPQNITEGNGDDGSGGAKLCKASAFHCGKMFADGIDLCDFCAACQKLVCHIRHVCQCQRTSRFFEQCGTATGNEKNDGIFFCEVFHCGKDFFCSCNGIFVNQRMAAFSNDKTGDFSLAMIVFCQHNAVVDGISQ